MEKKRNEMESLGIPFLNPYLSLRRQTQVLGVLLCVCSICCLLALAYSYRYQKHQEQIRQQTIALSTAKGKNVQEISDKLQTLKVWGDEQLWQAFINRIHKASEYKKNHPNVDIIPYIYPAQEQYLTSINHHKIYWFIAINALCIFLFMIAYINRCKDEAKENWIREKEINLETQRNLMNLSVSLHPYVERQFTAPISSDYKDILGLLTGNINSIILMLIGFLSGLNRKNGDLQINAQMLKSLLNQISTWENKGFPQIQDIVQKLESLNQASNHSPVLPVWEMPPKDQALQLHKHWANAQEAEQMGFNYVSDISDQFKQLESLFEQHSLLAITLDWAIQSLNWDDGNEIKYRMLKDSLNQSHQLSDKIRQEIHNIHEKLGFYRQKRDITLQNATETQILWNQFIEKMVIQQEQNSQWQQFGHEYSTFHNNQNHILDTLLERMRQTSESAQEWNNKVIAQQHGLSQMDNLLNDFILRLQDLNETIKSIRLSEAETPTPIMGANK